MAATITPFRIDLPEAEWFDLKRRLRTTRWPEKEPVDDWSQGVPLAVVQDLCDYWADSYEWRAREVRLNAFPQFRTVIDGLGIHFVYVRSPHADAIPLVLTHGWPGSFVEYLGLIGKLTEPTRGRDAFHVVIPSLPGYGFSDRPAETGWDVNRIALAWVELMRRLGFVRFGAAGSDWGTSVSAAIGEQRPSAVIGLHLIPPLAPPDPATFDHLTPAEAAAIADLERSNAQESAYSAMHATKPQTAAFGLVDSPAAMTAWMLEKFWAWTDHDGDLYSLISRDTLIDNLMVYWITQTGGSSIRLYRESFDDIWLLFNSAAPAPIDVPVGASVFARETPRPSQRWAAKRFTDIRFWSEPPRGGHFPALEQPDALVHDLRVFFRGLR